ncbi:MAG: thioredoxin domain-containing protein, partial [Gemmatimonadota bacterium]
DDKVLADWNGKMLRALAEAGRLLERDDLLQSARSLARFLLDTMQRDGHLCHAWRAGTLRNESYLSDHAQVGLGLAELHAANGELEWLQSAHALCEQMVARFHDPDAGFFDSEPGELPVRARDLFDGALPSATAAACELLLRLAGAYERGDWADIVQRTIARHGALLEQAPSAVPALLHAHLLNERGGELVLPVEEGKANALVRARAEFAPLVTVVSAPPDALPLLAGRTPGWAYLCRHGSCRLPARTLDELRSQLAQHHAS